MGYTVLLAPVVGVVMTDYFLLRGRVLDVDGLYSSSPSGPYWYQVRLAGQDRGGGRGGGMLF